MRTNEQSVAGWVIRGMGGIVAMIVDLLESEIELGEHWYGELVKWTDKLNAAVNGYRARAGK